MSEGVASTPNQSGSGAACWLPDRGRHLKDRGLLQLSTPNDCIARRRDRFRFCKLCQCISRLGDTVTSFRFLFGALSVEQ